MKFRYIRKGSLYYPQYFGKEDKWYFFEKEKINLNSDLLIGIQGFMNYLKYNVKQIDDLFIKRNDKNILCFLDEFTIYTFLGATTYWFKTQKIEYNIDINEQETIN